MPDLTLVLLTLLWGTTFSLVKGALAGTTTAALLLARFAIATLVLALLAGRGRPAQTPGLFRDAGVLGVLMAAGFVLQTEGLVHTTPARSAFFTGLTVLFVPFVSWAIYRRRLSLPAFVAAVIAAFGLALLTHPSARMPLVATAGGDLLSLGCAVAFAFHIVWTSEWSQRHDLARLTLVEIAVALGALGIYALFAPLTMTPTPGLIATLVFLGAGMTAGAFLLQNWAQRRVTPVRAALIFTLEPVAAAIFAWFHRGDRLTALELAGGSLIIAGVLVGELTTALTPKRPA